MSAMAYVDLGKEGKGERLLSTPLGAGRAMQVAAEPLGGKALWAELSWK